MKVLKIKKPLIKQLEEMDSLLREIKKEKIIDVETLTKNTRSIFEIKKLYHDFSPVDLTTLNNFLIEMNNILRYLILQKLDFNKFFNRLNKISNLIDKSIKDAYYDFFRLCKKCSNCCESARPHIFSFEHKFIEKYRDFLERDGQSYATKINPKTGWCLFYDEKAKKCTIHNHRPLDCIFFPFTFIVKKITAPKINAYPRNYIFLCKATKCDVIDRLSLSDALESLEIICYILSKITLEEAMDYSVSVDPRKILFDISIPYDDRKTYHNALKQILHSRIYREN